MSVGPAAASLLALLARDVGIARARSALGEAADHPEAIRLIEAQAGVEIRG